MQHLNICIEKLVSHSDCTQTKGFPSVLEIMCARNMTSVLGFHKGAGLIHYCSHYIRCHRAIHGIIDSIMYVSNTHYEHLLLVYWSLQQQWEKSGDEVFVNYAPKLWNKLPVDIEEASSLNILKRKLKT